MDYVKPVDFKQLKAFFLALQQGYFKPDSKQASATVLVDGVRTPVDKGYCLKLLRSFPDLQGDQFNDDASIIKYLQDPNNRKRLLGHLTQEQQIEITKLLAERPTATGAVGEQPGGGETSAEQGVPAQTPVDTTAGAGGMPGFPSGPSISSARQRIFRIPHAPEPSKIAAANKPVFQRPRLPYSVTNAFKNFGSAAQRFTAANLGRIGRGLGEIAKGVGRGIAGPGLTGTYNLLGKAANGTLNAFERLSGSGLRSATSRSFASSGSKKLVWGLILGLSFFVIFSGLIGGITGTTPSGGAAPAPGFIGTLPPSNPDCPKLHDEIYNQFKVDFDQKNPFSCDYLQWAWEKLWNISNTKFLDLVRGPDKNKIITVKREDKGFNEQTGCPSIIMSGISSVNQKPYPKSLFQVVFIHELTHVIQSCNPSAVNLTTLTTALNQEGGITTFSQDPTKCIKGVTQLNEDFAETLAYYLNQEWGEQSYFSTCPPKDSTNPILRGDKPLHQQFAAELLGSSVPLSTALPQISCPVVGGGVNILPSYQASPEFGHCGEKYADKIGACTDGVNSRRAKSIDIESCLTPRPACTIDTCKPLTAAELAIYNCGQSGKNVELPSMSDQPNLKWERLDNIPLSQGDCFDYEIVDPNGLGGGCGIGYVFRADLGGGKNWVLHLLHMGSINSDIQIGGSYSPGTVIGKAQAVHIHISIGKDIQNPLSQNEAGWMAADTNLKLCQ